MRNHKLIITFVVCTLGLVLTSCGEKKPVPGTVLDEARRAERMRKAFRPPTKIISKHMDGGIELTVDEVKGRNNWLVWTGGNDRFWDHLVNKSFGVVDLLKILSSHPKLPHLTRDKRWEYLGLVNEPCFEKAKGPQSRSFRPVARHAH